MKYFFYYKAIYHDVWSDVIITWTLFCNGIFGIFDHFRIKIFSAYFQRDANCIFFTKMNC